MTKESSKNNNKTVKKTKSKKVSNPETKETSPVQVAPSVQEPVSTTPSVETTPVDTPVDTPLTSTTNDADDLSESFRTLLTNVNAISVQMKNIVSDVKRMERRVGRELKEANRKSKSKKNKNLDKPKRAPSGFAKPSDISTELCDFLQMPSGSQLARTEVTKHITRYIREHNLQNPENKRHILPDAKLGSLLNVSDSDEVTYFNLQKYMKHHFPKSLSAMALPTN